MFISVSVAVVINPITAFQRLGVDIIPGVIAVFESAESIAVLVDRQVCVAGE